MKPTVLLFDIDGTLVTTGGVGRRSLEKAFEKRFARPGACAALRLDGMTDRAIVRHGLETMGLSGTEEEIDAMLAAYVETLEAEVLSADMSRYRVHQGMVEALDAARARGHAIGLGTGNIREGARVKLTRVGIYERFAFGGFGCDHEHRVELIRVGAQRGAARLGRPVEECRVVVIGDTPKDVAAAKGIGAECLGVGTGSFTPSQLIDSGATFAFQNLAAPGAIDALLG
jgi:phosphoglycolate phosphatase-like HAD superfamily hydrolase